MKLVNLFPFALPLTDGEDNFVELPANEDDLQVFVEYKVVDKVDGMPVFNVVYKEGLPEPEPGVVFVVSSPIRQLCYDRKDLASPGQPVQDEDGEVVGFLGVIKN